MANTGVEIREFFKFPYAGWPHCSCQRDHEVSGSMHQFFVIPLLNRSSLLTHAQQNCQLAFQTTAFFLSFISIRSNILRIRILLNCISDATFPVLTIIILTFEANQKISKNKNPEIKNIEIKLKPGSSNRTSGI